MPAGKFHTAYELDLRDWGMWFGIAFGIARAEDPFESVESVESVAARALAAAHVAFDGFDPRGYTTQDGTLHPIPSDGEH